MFRNPVKAITVVATALSVWACASRPDPYMGSPARGQMITHFDLALEVRQFALHGELEEFRRAARDLAELEPAHDLPAEIILQLGPMRWEAREAAMADTREEAAAGAAKIAQTCGTCHTENGVPLGERFTLGGPPPVGSPARHMAGLNWASRLLWDGLVGPSDRTWFAGAEGIKELGALPEALPTGQDANTVAAMGARLRQLADRAVTSRTAPERVEVLGDIWATCAACHAAGR
ncbi:MAG: hypothetical protein OXU33_12805 [Gemmatimonadota bacterium]|nr:hypothetical protein [Gemmatimonadota bacterium]